MFPELSPSISRSQTMFIGKFYLSFLASVVLLCFCMAGLVLPSTIFTDESALLTFKAHITDPDNILDYNWTTATSFCNWIGVSCSHRRQRVTALNLPNRGLEGTIPPHVGNLSFLVSFQIFNNSFHGYLPKELGLLYRLKSMDLQFNKFSGEIPISFGFLLRLQKLLLNNNSFTGTIPPSLGNITKLELLSLESNSLQGKIPKEIGNLHNLQVLYIADNYLLGSIPATIFNISSLLEIDLSSNSLSGTLSGNMCGRHPKLKGLYLSRNQLSGQIPSSLCNCIELQKISLSYNTFTGRIPREMGNLSMLGFLSLGRNDLIDTVPPSIGNLTMLEKLDISSNGVYGNIPQELGHLSHLQLLNFGTNNLSGELPQSVFNISTLEMISFVENNLSGHLPSNIDTQLPNLNVLVLGFNELSGMIPASISNASKLTILDLAHNYFSGFVPTTLGNLNLLQFLNLQVNQLTSEPSTSKLTFLTSLTNCRLLRTLLIGGNPLNGIPPDSIGNLSISIEVFAAPQSGITGIIPSGIGNLSNLIRFEFWENDLIGYIPITMGRLRKLQSLHILGNRVQGYIPTELCQLRHLANLIFSENRISGSIPNCIGNLSSLRRIYLDSNMLTSTIPPTLWSLKDLLVLSLFSNFLDGHLPFEVGVLNVVTYMDLSANQLSGNIPSTMGDLQNLAYLSLSRNKLQGLIPQSFGKLISLESLNISHNNLSGEIPKILEELLHLKYLDVSFNRLQGEIPSGGSFANFTAQSFLGNDALCGMPRLQVPPCPVTARPQSRIKLQTFKYIIPIVMSTIIAVALIFLLVMYRRGKIKSPIQADLSLSTTHKRISYQELLYATDDFDECNLLGVGGFSSVYKGVFLDRTIVAIKVFNLEFPGAFKSFDAECEVMRNIRHRNLVKIISSCSNLDFRAMVLEYIPNGSLEKWLYSHNYCLNVIQRLDIMIDVASALEYLHHGYSRAVVHCDLKPSNILLDEDMVGHVGDFGIAKILAENESDRHTKTLGTIGYVAPEYGSEGRVSIEGDVYSYGIMLMETFTRKKPTDEMFVGGLSLKQWVNESLPDAVIEVIDANLLLIEEDDLISKKHCVTSIIKLALECSAESPTERIKMNNIVVRLKKIKMKYLSKAEGA